MRYIVRYSEIYLADDLVAMCCILAVNICVVYVYQFSCRLVTDLTRNAFGDHPATHLRSRSGKRLYVVCERIHYTRKYK